MRRCFGPWFLASWLGAPCRSARDDEPSAETPQAARQLAVDEAGKPVPVMEAKYGGLPCLATFLPRGVLHAARTEAWAWPRPRQRDAVGGNSCNHRNEINRPLRCDCIKIELIGCG